MFIKGYKQTEEHKRKSSISHKGQKAWNKNIPLSEEHKRNLCTFTKEQELQICAEYFSDKKVNTYVLAKKWNCSNVTISNIIKKNGYKLRNSSECHKGQKAWNIGLTKETDERVRRGSDKLKGQKRSEEQRNNLSISCMGRKAWNKDLTKETDERVKKVSNSTKGKKHNPMLNVTKEKISKTLTGRKFSEETKQKKHKFSKEQEVEICNEYFSEEKPSTTTLAQKWSCGNATITSVVKRNGYVLRTYKEIGAQNIKKYKGPFKDTKPELKMKEILNELNIPFEHQYRLKGYSFDFYISNSNILVEVDGDYWHGNPKKFSKLNERQKEIKQRDFIKNKVAKDSGFVLLRFWEDDILNNAEEVKNELRIVI